ILGEDFLDNEPGVLILGDNIFEDDFTEAIQSFAQGGRIFAKKVSDPERFGVVEFDQEGKVLSIEEKPEAPKSEYAIPGIYIFDGEAANVAKRLTPSERGELEIVDMHRQYLAKGTLDVRIIEGAYFDAGTHDALLLAGNYAKEKKLGERFHPILKETISEFNKEFKRLVSLK
ncbi:MAG: sugar phosphate nucleotidyltransferase, partial [Candidatus Moraniibacteriota bacterium]